MPIFFYSVGVLALTAGLVVFSYLDRAYRELGRVYSGRTRRHLDTFESEIEPRFHMDRSRAALTFSLLARFWLVFVAAITARGVLFFVPGTWEAAVEMILFLGAEVVIAMQFFPALLIARAPGNWVLPFVPVVRAFAFLIWPVQAVLELLISVLHLSEEKVVQTPAAEQQQAIEAFVDAATEEGIIEQDEARLIESVVEFGDKRVRDVMTPRPDVISIRATASLEELRDLVVETKFSRLPVHEKTLDDIAGIVMARDMLEVPDSEAGHRIVRELVRPALFVPETKFGSELLKEMQRKNQQMAVVIDEYGLMAGVVTIEDLVEEIVGEIGEEDRTPAPDVVREPGGALVIRGSVQLEKVGELFGVRLDAGRQHSAATTIAGLLNSVAGHVPRTGEVVEADGLRFEVIEANQRKVLRVRAKPLPSVAASSAGTS
jgi:putative hemolysin